MKAFKCRFETTYDVNRLMEKIKENNLLMLIRRITPDDNGLDITIEFLVAELDEEGWVANYINKDRLINIMESVDDLHVGVRTLEEFFIT